MTPLTVIADDKLLSIINLKCLERKKLTLCRRGSGGTTATQDVAHDDNEITPSTFCVGWLRAPLQKFTAAHCRGDRSEQPALASTENPNSDIGVPPTSHSNYFFFGALVRSFEGGAYYL